MTKKIASAKLLNLDLVEMPAIKVPIYSGGLLKFKSPLKKSWIFSVGGLLMKTFGWALCLNPVILTYMLKTHHVFYFVETHFWFVASAASAMANIWWAENQAYNHAMCIDKQ